MSRKTEVARVAKRGYWKETDGRIIVEAWRSSGKTLSDFADRHGVDPKRITRWATRLGRAKPEAVQFHPVRLAGVEAESGSGSAIEIRLISGQRVRLAHGFETEDLRRVLAVLEAARC